MTRPRLRSPASLEQRYATRVASARWRVVRTSDGVLLSGHASERDAQRYAASANERRPGSVRVESRGAR